MFENMWMIMLIFLATGLFVTGESGQFYISSSRPVKNPCDHDENQCVAGICIEIEKSKERNFVCACPLMKSGALCEKPANDCLKCKPTATTECTSFPDGTAVCICLEYNDKQTDAPSICAFKKKRRPERQRGCKVGDYVCTPGQECVNYAQDQKKVNHVCQCPAGNTRGHDNCAEDYKMETPGDMSSCVDTGKYGPICMCKKYGAREEKYGFCKPKLVQKKLVGLLNEEENGACSVSRNKCRHGTCVLTGKDKFFCACPVGYSGKYCHLAANDCLKCKPKETTECTSLPDGTAVCICLKYNDKNTVAPSICSFKKKRRPERQRGCKVGDYVCTPGQECVNYAQDRKKVNHVCQCPAGNTRGSDNCAEDYKIDTPGEKYACVDTGKYGPICFCKKYGIREEKYGFCKPNRQLIGQPTGPLSESGPCSATRNKCRHGTCVVTDKDKFFCACPVGYSGKYCHFASNDCLKCKPTATTECTSFPDGTAVCICLQYNDKNTDAPSICGFKKKRRPERQRGCKVDDYVCTPGQECVNYAQDRKKVNLVCQCPAGNTRGSDNCAEEYKMDTPGDKYACVDTDKYGPICFCKKYGAREEKYGFCKPNTGQLTGQLTGPLSEGDPCSPTRNKCRHGKCVVTDKDKFLCACPLGYSGKYCHYASNDCLKCKPKATTECTSFPDGTAVCVCLEYNDKNTESPSICAFKKKRRPERQRGCKVGDYICTPGQECVNYAQDRKKVNHVCQCPVGNTRGSDNCVEDYKIDTPGDKYSCVDADKYGTICMCKKYGVREDKYGFCKPRTVQPQLTRPLSGQHTGEPIGDRTRQITGSLSGQPTGQRTGKLTGPLIEGDPCSATRNKCRHGKCLVTDKDKFVCACPAMYSGKYCHVASNNCLKCKPEATTECTSFPDGTAVCICLEYTNKKTVTPSICAFKKKRRPERQRGCKVGDYVCSPGQECVNYAQDRGKVNHVCQCPAGNTRGSDNCAEDYKMDTPGDMHSCVDTGKYGTICMCRKYGIREEKYGFCKPSIGQPKLNGPLSKGDPCSATRNKCRHGTCVVTDKDKFVCACPAMYSGKYCHVATNNCLKCKPKATTECTSFPDGTAVCICLEYTNKQTDAPSICAFKKKRRPERQRACRLGEYECTRGQECVNYAQDRRKVNLVCQCSAGNTRGADNCAEDYKIDTPGDKYACVDTDKYGPICMCKKYGVREEKYGFCKLNRQHTRQLTGPLSENDACSVTRNKCRHGKCVLTGNDKFVCACPLGYSGKYCHYASNDCLKCKPTATTECTSFPDGTAVCICLQYNDKQTDAPSICGFKKKRRPERQRGCKVGDHVCPTGQECVNYAQDRKKVNLVCQCPAGKTRGSDNCQEEYKMDTPGDKYACVDTDKYGTICMCKKYGAREEKYGFCKPTIGQPQLTGQPTGQHNRERTRQHNRERTRQHNGERTGQHNRERTRQHNRERTRQHNGERTGQHNRERTRQPTGEHTRQPTGEHTRQPTGERTRQPTGERTGQRTGQHTAQPTGHPPGQRTGHPTGQRTGHPTGHPTGQHTVQPTGHPTAQPTGPLNGSKQVDHCASRPCLHDGVCKQHPTTNGLDFICVCPLGRKGKTCSEVMPDCDSLQCTETMDCISTPDGAICICIVHYQQQMCSVKMRTTTEWEKVKLVLTSRSIREVEILAGIVLMFVALMLICVMRHCMKASSQRKKYNERYNEAVEKGNIPTAPLPDWLDISNDIIRQTICCGSSSLPQTFMTKKKKMKKDKIKKLDQTEDENSPKNIKKQNQNENSPVSKSRHGSRSESYHNKNLKDYIDSHESQFAHTSSRGTTQSTAGTARVMQYPQVHESCNPWIKVERHKKYRK